MAKSPISVNLYCPTLAMGMGNESFFGKAASQCWSKVEGPTPSKKMYGISSVKNTGFKFLYQWKITERDKSSNVTLFFMMHFLKPRNLALIFMWWFQR